MSCKFHRGVRASLLVCLAIAFAFLPVREARAAHRARSAAGNRDAAVPLPDRPHYAIEHFGERFGLSAITVISLAQDPQGFLWIGSQSGIYRYDGSNITSFGLAEGLPGLHTSQLLIAPGGAVWVRVRKGLARLEGRRFVPVSIPPEAGNLTADPQSFAVNSSGMLFVSVEHGLLLSDLKTGGTQLLGPSDGLPAAHVEAIVRGPDDVIWLAAGRHLARILPGSSRLEIFSAPELPAGPVRTLLFGNHGQLWIRTASHLATLDTKNLSSAQLAYHDKNLPAANGEGSFVLDCHGNPMVPTSFGLYRLLDGRWQIVDHANGLTSSAAFSALEDREGNIWVGLAGAGLDRWPGWHQWSGWTEDVGLPDPLVLSIVRDSRARLWVGTNTALSTWDPETHRWQVWNKKNGLVGGGIRSLALAKDGALWAFSPGAGVTRFDTSSARLLPIPALTGNLAASISSVALAPDGALWTSSEKGIRIVRSEKNRFASRDLALPATLQGTANFISISPGGILWGGGPNGISRFDGKQWKKFDVSDGLLEKASRSVAAVNDDEVWIGYNDVDHVTRARLRPDGTLELHHVAQGACLLGADRSGNAWLEMYDSAARLSPDGSLRKFTQGDGLLWNDTNCGAFWQESDGTILIGTSHGLARFDPAQEDLPRVPLPVALTQVQFAGADRLADAQPLVPYKQASFSAQFAALTFRDPASVRCRYRLDGLESAFTETAMREARYPALPPGVYTFEVSCGSSDLGWSATPATYSFTVLSPWWRSPFALLAALLALGLIIAGLTHLRTRRLESERKRLEAAVAERSSELARANRELEEASLTDPLTGIRNRRYFSSTIPADADQARRAYSAIKGSYSLDHRDLIFYLVDLDHFKKINDTFGHAAGDDLLVEVAGRLSRIVRQSDLLIRWGGEEFLIVCRAAERKHAAILAEKILSVVALLPFSISQGNEARITCSVGWAPYPWQPGAAPLTVDEVIKLADTGLYRAKELGRNHAVGMLPPESVEVPVGVPDSAVEFDPSQATSCSSDSSPSSTRELIIPGLRLS